MTEFLQQLINGLSLGAIYALIALGYTMVYGVLRFINFAHSDVFMIGAFVGWAAVNKWNFPSGSIGAGLLVLVVAMVICAALGVVIEKLAYKPLRGRSTLTVLITAIGVSLLIQNVAQNSRIGFGPNPKAYPNVFPATKFIFETAPATTNFTTATTSAPAQPIVTERKTVTLSSTQIAVFLVSIGLLAFLHWIVHRTRIGTAMRALSFNATAASLVGINNNAVISFTFALGSAMAGAGGVLYAMSYPSIDPLMGTLPGLKAFVAAVLGGIGNLPGAALGGLLIGLTETFVSGSKLNIGPYEVQLSTYRDAIVFAILILILIFRPSGLLGKIKAEKV